MICKKIKCVLQLIKFDKVTAKCCKLVPGFSLQKKKRLKIFVLLSKNQ